jgi:uncharacterized membrane protein
MTFDTATVTPSACRKLRLALMASLALNVLIIGGVAGTMLFGPRGPHHKSGPLLGFAHTLPSERGDMIRQNVADAQPGLETLRKAERDARDAVHAALIEEPFDQGKFNAALDRSAAADAKEKSARLAVFAKTAGQLTPEERRELHDWLERHNPR